MTHDILQSDIELAIRLRDDQRPDEEIILALTQRGVDPAKAAQLVDDLHKGIRPTPQSAIPMEFTLPRRSRPRTDSSSHRPAEPAGSSRPQSPSAPSPKPARQAGKSPASFRLTVAAVVGLVLTVAAVVLVQRHKAGTYDLESQPPMPFMPKLEQPPRAGPAKAAAPSADVSLSPLVLELQPDGLHLGGRLVTGGNVLAAVVNLLGLPSRTNQVERTDTVIYAYDRQGLLIYTQKGGGTNRIVLDCDASGGANGTTSAFAGSLKVEDQVIGPATDSRTLGAIKKLGLNRPSAGGSIWSGRYDGLELAFAYLVSPQRLSLIEIDLK